MSDEGVSQRELAAACGVRKTVVARWLDPEQPNAMRVHELILVPRPIARSLLERVAPLIGLEVSKAAGDTTIDDHREHLTTLLVELPDVSATYSRVLTTHDGHITNDELLSLEKEVREGRDALLKLARWIDAERAERGLV